jgi:hypothetical protein
MAVATVNLKVSPNELQFIKAALECYIGDVKDGDYIHVDLTPAGNEQHKAILITSKLIQDIGLKS